MGAIFLSTSYYTFEKGKERGHTVFDISYYKAFKKYLIFLGQYPYQSQWIKKRNMIMIMLSLLSLLIPAILQLVKSIVEKNINMVMETIPTIVTIIVCMIKILNHSISKDKFHKLFELVKKEWDLLNDNNGAYVLDDVTRQGNKLAELYRTSLLLCMVVFLSLPVIPVILDVILPLNETRPRQQILKLYYIVDEDEYFYSIYLHSSWSSFVIVIIIITIDSLYILIVHHCCGLFALCGYMIKKTIELSDVNKYRVTSEQFVQFALMHEKALQVYEMMNNCSCNSYLFQVGFNMIGITVTGVQTVMYLDQPEEAIRTAIFLAAQQFHLFIISLPGQVLMDYSVKFLNDIYDSIWYKIPVKNQRMLHIMQTRSCKICKLTAGGLYEMNIENFGVIFKTCVSYFTVLSSLRD